MRNKIFLTAVMILLLAVCALNGKTYKFAVICDTRSDAQKSGKNGVNVAAVQAVCKDLKKRGAEFVLAPGDFICGNVSWYLPHPPCSKKQFETLLDAMASQGVGLPGSGQPITLYPSRGNHEDYHDIFSKKHVMKVWYDTIGKHLPQNGPDDPNGFNYYFKRGDLLFIALDEYMDTPKSEKVNIRINQTWLDQVLKENDGHVFVFGHTPAFAANHKDCLGENPPARDAFLRSIYKRSCVYFCGHDHFYARASIPVYYNQSNFVETYMQQVITPSGAPFLTGSRSDNHKWDGYYENKDVNAETYIDNAVGYQLVTVTHDRVKVEFIATLDACSHTIDKKGVYHYIYHDNWEDWHFAVKDHFHRHRPEKIHKRGKKKVIVDTDMGWDDTLSLLYLMKNPDIDIIGVTVTGCGETHLAAGLDIALRLMEMGNQNAKVYAGTDTPTWPASPVKSPAQYHRFPKTFRDDMDTLMGLRETLPKTDRKVEKQKAWDYIAETLNTINEPVTILSLGGFTNLGKMLTLHPDVNLNQLENVYTMGGAIWVDGNISLLNNAKPQWNQGPIYATNLTAEWNMFVDPGAAKQVFQSAIPVTLIPLDACDYVMLDKSFIDTITADDPIAKLAKAIFEQKTGHSSEGIPVPIFDPLATLTMAGAMDGAQYHHVGLDILTEDTQQGNTCGRVYVVHNPTRKKCDVVQGVSEFQFAKAYAEIINRKIEAKK